MIEWWLIKVASNLNNIHQLFRLWQLDDAMHKMCRNLLYQRMDCWLRFHVQDPVADDIIPSLKLSSVCDAALELFTDLNMVYE